MAEQERQQDEGDPYGHSLPSERTHSSASTSLNQQGASYVPPQTQTRVLSYQILDYSSQPPSQHINSHLPYVSAGGTQALGQYGFEAYVRSHRQDPQTVDRNLFGNPSTQNRTPIFQPCVDPDTGLFFRTWGISPDPYTQQQYGAVAGHFHNPYSEVRPHSQPSSDTSQFIMPAPGSNCEPANVHNGHAYNPQGLRRRQSEDQAAFLPSGGFILPRGLRNEDAYSPQAPRRSGSQDQALSNPREEFKPPTGPRVPTHRANKRHTKGPPSKPPGLVNEMNFPTLPRPLSSSRASARIPNRRSAEAEREDVDPAKKMMEYNVSLPSNLKNKTEVAERLKDDANNDRSSAEQPKPVVSFHTIPKPSKQKITPQAEKILRVSHPKQGTPVTSPLGSSVGNNPVSPPQPEIWSAVDLPKLQQQAITTVGITILYHGKLECQRQDRYEAGISIASKYLAVKHPLIVAKVSKLFTAERFQFDLTASTHLRVIRDKIFMDSKANVQNTQTPDDLDMLLQSWEAAVQEEMEEYRSVLDGRRGDLMREIEGLEVEFDKGEMKMAANVSVYGVVEMNDLPPYLAAFKR